MFSSKGIKTFCKTVVFSSYGLSAMAVLYGLSHIRNDNYFYPLIVVGGAFVFALFVTISVYPLYAMANMSERLESIEETVKQIEINILMNQNKKAENSFQKKNTIENFSTPNIGVAVSLQDTVEFVNNKYGIDLRLDDSCEELKRKIQTIKIDSPQVIRFINKVSEAESEMEIFSILRMHKVAYK